MSVILPSASVFDPHRDAGADIPAAIAAANAVTATPPGQEIVQERTVWNGLIKRGTLDANGKRLTSFYFPKSLSQVDGVTLGSAYSPYTHSDGFFKGKADTLSIIKDMDFICPNTYAPAHHYEKGWNIVDHRDPSARLIFINCGFYNADTAFVLGGDHSHVYNCKIGVRGSVENGVYVKPRRGGMAMHYGGRLYGTKQVIEGLRVDLTAYHDVSTQKTTNCVFKDVAGIKLKTDFHAWSGDEGDDNNLFINLNRGTADGPRCFASGGATANLPWTGDGTLFYNDRRGDGSLVPASWYPSWLHATIIPDTTTPPPAPIGFPLGQAVKTTVQVNVRSEPRLAATLIGTQPLNTHGTTISEAALDGVSGFTYQRIDFGSGVDGYVGLVSSTGVKNVVAV